MKGRLPFILFHFLDVTQRSGKALDFFVDFEFAVVPQLTIMCEWICQYFWVFWVFFSIFEHFPYYLRRGHELHSNFCRFCIQSCLPTHSCNSASKQEEHISKGWYIIYPISYMKSIFELQEFFYDPDNLPFQKKTRRVL